MKLFKIILILTINIILNSNLVFADNLHFEKISQSQKFGNKIMQQVNLSFYSNSPWKLYAQVLDLNIQNQTNPNYFIPLSRFEISNLGQLPFSNFENSKQIEIKNSDTNVGMNNLNFNFAINTQDIDRPGFYTCDIKFTLVDNNQNIIAQNIYNYNFEIDEIAKIEFSNPLINLPIDKDKILQKNTQQNLKMPLTIYVTSNKDWKLYVKRKTNDIDDNLKITPYIKIISAANSINPNLSTNFTILNNDEVLVASGKATFNDSIRKLDKQFINLDYLIKGPKDTFLKSGSKLEEFEYRLETY
ncbi:MAG: hypothetical protein BHW64_03870 [Candidatus Melainabacteria bacterium LEY3_CP_29_8]|nr:MAG: hypothetical protein BHW64_03870 [Candidatus Melainabacteria bacterium LEY3_CP_29_8]